MTDGILSGIRVIEWGDLVSGPWTSRLLADMGADVIKIEAPGTGDTARRVGPFPGDIPHPETSGLYLYLNINKRGITLDLNKAEGRQIFQELVGGADFLVENHPPRVVEDLGLNYSVLQALNPRLIMVSISPFGQTGPYRDYVGSELVLFHMGGIGYETPLNDVTDLENQRPLKGPGYQAYFASGWLASTTAMVALFHREITGEGQHIDISEQEAIASTERPKIALYSYSDEVFSRLGNGIPRFKQCKDGYFAGLAAQRDDIRWGRMANLMGNPDWTKEEMCATTEARIENVDVIEALIGAWMMDYTKEELFSMGQDAGLGVFPVNTVADVYATEQYRYRGFFQKVEHPVAGTHEYPGIPYKLSDLQPTIRNRAPLLGEHNAEVICQELKRTPQELVRLYQAGVL
jgi:crotonobetainyl-CoA:carnitine CoA-transferase CaiB-like acyl-CoA transferase